MRKLLFPAFLIFAVAVPIAGFSFAVPDKEEASYKQYIDYCLKTANKREVCDCTYQTAKQNLSYLEIGQAAYNLRANAAADSVHVSKITQALAACSKQEEERAASLIPPPPPIPDAPTSIPPINQTNEQALNLNVPPPPPLPSPETASAEPKKQETIDSEETNFLSQIKKKKQPAPEETTQKSDETEPKKYGKASKKTYFGEYNEQYFAAAASGDLKALQAITPYLDKVDIQNDKGDTPLILATKHGHVAAIKFLISQKADVNKGNYKKQAPIHLASLIKRPDIVELLLANKADVNVTYLGGYTPIMVAINAQDETTIKLLAKKGAQNSVLDNGDTLLHLAAATNNQSIINLLSKLGSDLEEKNKLGETPLISAAKQNKAAAVIKLLEMGASLDSVDNYGHNAYQVAYSAKAFDAANAILTFANKR